MCRAEVIVVTDGIMVDFEVSIEEAAVLARNKAKACYAAGLPFTILFTRIPCENLPNESEVVL